MSLNHQAALANAMQRPGFRQAWDELEEEYNTLHALLDARKAAELTQDELAQRMGTTMPSSLRGRHFPSSLRGRRPRQSIKSWIVALRSQ